jgi:hypothetical protein
MKGHRRGPGSDASHLEVAGRPAGPKVVTSNEPPRLVLYGLAEIVELVDYSRTNTVRLRKQLPPPDITLKMGPVWFGGTIKKWLAERSAS